MHPCQHNKTQYHVHFGCHKHDIMEFRVYMYQVDNYIIALEWSYFFPHSLYTQVHVVIARYYYTVCAFTDHDDSFSRNC
jgi:hypothetical protein